MKFLVVSFAIFAVAFAAQSNRVRRDIGIDLRSGYDYTRPKFEFPGQRTPEFAPSNNFVTETRPPKVFREYLPPTTAPIITKNEPKGFREYLPPTTAAPIIIKNEPRGFKEYLPPTIAAPIYDTDATNAFQGYHVPTPTPIITKVEEIRKEVIVPIYKTIYIPKYVNVPVQVPVAPTTTPKPDIIEEIITPAGNSHQPSIAVPAREYGQPLPDASFNIDHTRQRSSYDADRQQYTGRQQYAPNGGYNY